MTGKMQVIEIVLFLSSCIGINYCNSDNYLKSNKAVHGIVYKLFVRLSWRFKSCY